MAIALNGGHVARALAFYEAVGKYFIIGGTQEWKDSEGNIDDSTPTSPKLEDFKLLDVIGLKRVDNAYLVIPTTETENVISYRDQNWKIVEQNISTIVTAAIAKDSNSFTVNNASLFKIGYKVRIANLYEGVITNIVNNRITLSTNAPSIIPVGSIVQGGAVVEGAKYVYIECYLDHDKFPVNVSYRQIGICTGVPSTADTLLSAEYSSTKADEYSSLGTLEILDNRTPSYRANDQRELLSLIIEF